MFFIYKMCEGSAYLRAFALILGAATAAVFWSPRPQMFSFFLSAVVLYLLYLYRRKQVDRLWLIPIIMGVWGNLHAGFSIGFIFLGGVIAGEILGRLFNPQGEYLAWRGIRKLVVIALISVAALVINPYGLQMLLVPFQTVSIGALRNYIQEWNSPNFQGRETLALHRAAAGRAGRGGREQAAPQLDGFRAGQRDGLHGAAGGAQHRRVRRRRHAGADLSPRLDPDRARLGAPDRSGGSRRAWRGST